MKFPVCTCLLFALAAGARGQTAHAPQETAPPAAPAARTDAQEGVSIESHRLRVVNCRDGQIQISSDGGRAWRRIGRVLRPATTTAEGHIAAEYAAPATVAATAVHGIRIRTSADDGTLHAPRLLSLVPREYGKRPNHGFGGVVAGSAGIVTDIPAGTGLFRDLAPRTGDPVFLEGKEGRLTPLPATFRPSGDGETLVVVARIPQVWLTEVIFENRAGGAVTATFSDGHATRLASVLKPVFGVGRFDGTAFTGVGRINTAHTGVVTVSTAPIDNGQEEGIGRERRGGFQISPAWHNSRCDEAGAPMVLTIGAMDEGGKPLPKKRLLEGAPPLFRDQIGLAGGQAVADCAIDGGSWEPLPAVLGAQLDAFTGPGLSDLWQRQGSTRRCKSGITALRLRLPRITPAYCQLLADDAVHACQERQLAEARSGKMPIVRGVVPIPTNPTNPRLVAFVRLLIDGKPKGFTNVRPFVFQWDTTRVPDGEYLVEAEALDEAGMILATTRRRVYVWNEKKSG